MSAVGRVFSGMVKSGGGPLNNKVSAVGGVARNFSASKQVASKNGLAFSPPAIAGSGAVAGEWAHRISNLFHGQPVTLVTDREISAFEHHGPDGKTHVPVQAVPLSQLGRLDLSGLIYAGPVNRLGSVSGFQGDVVAATNGILKGTPQLL